jgi:hypothetical protein
MIKRAATSSTDEKLKSLQSSMAQLINSVEKRDTSLLKTAPQTLDL